jgi:hypothetical protein
MPMPSQPAETTMNTSSPALPVTDVKPAAELSAPTVREREPSPRTTLEGVLRAIPRKDRY